MNFHSYYEKLYTIKSCYPNQNLLPHEDKTVRNHLVKKTRLQNSIMFYDLLEFFLIYRSIIHETV